MSARRHRLVSILAACAISALTLVVTAATVFAGSGGSPFPR